MFSGEEAELVEQATENRAEFKRRSRSTDRFPCSKRVGKDVDMGAEGRQHGRQRARRACEKWKNPLLQAPMK